MSLSAEKTLYKIQDATVSAEDTVLLIQRALVLLGSASHAISQERRKIAWTRINPKFKSLATEEYSKREDNLFGPGFLEKAFKRVEVEKTLSKVSGNAGNQQGPPPSKRRRYESDERDLRSFLAKGAPARYGGRKNQHPYQPTATALTVAPNPTSKEEPSRGQTSHGKSFQTAVHPSNPSIGKPSKECTASHSRSNT